MAGEAEYPPESSANKGDVERDEGDEKVGVSAGHGQGESHDWASGPVGPYSEVHGMNLVGRLHLCVCVLRWLRPRLPSHLF